MPLAKAGKYPALIKVICWILGIVLALSVINEASSPLYIFVNDTSSPVKDYLTGATSPAVPVDLPPGGIQFVDMPYWWGNPDSLENYIVTPTVNLLFVKIVKISHLKKVPQHFEPQLD
jgi:hypothetical protein